MSTEAGLKITILCDNSAGRKGVAGRNGFSALVEGGGQRVLFDTGPGADPMLATAKALRMSLSHLDAVVISHGHYDHIGGLGPLLQTTGPQRVIAHPLIFRRRFSPDTSGGLREIGPPAPKESYAALGARWVLAEDPLWIGEKFFVTGEIPLAVSERLAGGLLAEEAGRLATDDFRDEIALVLNWAQQPVVLTGCAHRGVASIAAHARRLAGSDVIGLTVGGFHLAGQPEDVVARVAERLNELGVKAVAPCHCTGLAATGVLERVFCGRVIRPGTGDTLVLDSRGEVEIQPDAG
ncbi:MAG: MBL fold metallo-hydrolase [Armatimonadetes bacterium]|nr:MBL fold metallo-hydrolase [Armatimonadota bacterium]